MKTLRLFAFLAVLAFTAESALAASADQLPWSQRAANAAIARWPDGRLTPAGAPAAWNSELGALLEGMDSVWLSTADPRYFRYIRNSVDALLAPDGSIPTLSPEEHRLDDILLGRQLLLLYGVTRNQRYLTAATSLYDRLAHQPRNASGGFLHNRRNPGQMILSDLYLAEPFYAEYASISHHPEDFADITHQFALMEQHARNPRTGLLYDGWDESKPEPGADKQTGSSSEFRARAMGWYLIALIDTLDYYPPGDPGRAELLAILRRAAAAVARYQDPATGLWYDALNQPRAKGNLFESSSACMFVYALAKAVRLGYLPASYRRNAQLAYKAILSRFIKIDGDDVSLTDASSASSAGNTVHQVVANDPSGVGSFLLAGSEIETAQNVTLGRGRTVVVDGWFNSQQRTDAFGQQVYFHYKWNTLDDPGYSLFGHIFRSFGAATTELDAEPTLANLKGAAVYVIASPDNLDKNPHAHFADAQDAAQIAEWVKAGGVLMIMENDTSFADLDHFNVISEKFGIHFNSVLRKHVIGTNWEQGKIVIDANGPIFHHPHTIFVKDVCTISASGPAHSILAEGDDTFIATAKYGKGTVYAMVDPWLYNEYTDGRKLPAAYDNLAAGYELVRWVLDQVPR